jgi:hypothetical protein
MRSCARSASLVASCGPGPVWLHDRPGPRAGDAMHGIARTRRQRAPEATLLQQKSSKRCGLVPTRLEIKVTCAGSRLPCAFSNSVGAHPNIGDEARRKLKASCLRSLSRNDSSSSRHRSAPLCLLSFFLVFPRTSLTLCTLVATSRFA